MKKTFLLLASVAFFFTANAQEGGFKQAAGDKAFEVNFAPLGGNPIGISGIQFKSYSSETSAFRMNIFIGKSNNVTNISQQLLEKKAGGDSLFLLQDTKSSLEIGLRPGIEKHFAGTDRLSPYIGAELDVAKKFTTEKVETQNNYTTTADAPGEIYTLKTTGKDGFLRVGVNAVAGFDYFFAKKLYIGAEFGFGVSYKKMSKIKTKDEDTKAATEFAISQGAKIDPFKEADPQVQKGSSFNIGPNVNSAIRVGFLF